MKNYLLGLLAVPILSPLLSIASAADYTFVGSSDGCYSPSSVVFDTSFTIDSSSVSYTCPSDTDCFFGLTDTSTDNDCRIDLFDGDFSVSGDPCEIVAGVEYPLTCSSPGEVYSSITISDGQSSGGGSSDSVMPELSVPASFTSGITSLVNNFGSTIVGWLPAILLVTLGITAIFALFRVVRNYSRRSFKG